MIVAVAAMLMVQVTVHQVVHVISVRDCRMSAIGSMNMIRRVPGTGVASGTGRWIRQINIETMLLHQSTGSLMVQVSIVKIIDMVGVVNRSVPAVFAVYVFMIFVSMSHRISLLTRVSLFVRFTTVGQPVND